MLVDDGQHAKNVSHSKQSVACNKEGVLLAAKSGILRQCRPSERPMYRAVHTIDCYTVRHGHCLVHALLSQWLRVTSPLS